MTKRPTESLLDDDPLWYKDAIIYELHVKSFMDGNGDGIGDFRGLTSRLDYLEELGVTVIWVLPFYPSPLKDDGYDIADYLSINPDYGNLRDFREFLRAAHKRGMRVITELVLNHTSDQHVWFKRARSKRKGNKWRDYYVWSDDARAYADARIIFHDFERSNWTYDPMSESYYWHRFYHHQPDLNFDNPAVHHEMTKILDFWMQMGVDGVRLDAVPYLYEREGTNCENLPETFAYLRKLREHVDKKYPGRVFLAEANQWPEDAVAYFGAGDLCHMAFHFPLMPRMFMALQMEDSYPILDIQEQTPRIPENCQWALFLRNHDELTLEMVTDEERDYMYRMYARDPRARINFGIRRRLAPLLDNSRAKIELMNVLLFAMPGSVVIYYGDEIGMGDNYYLGDRDGVRTPMQWSSDRNAGFSRANPQRLFLPVIIDPAYHYEAVNVENQIANESSLLWWMRRLVGLRRAHKAFSRGDFSVLASDNPKTMAILRRLEEETILVVVNFSRHTQTVALDVADLVGRTPQELFSKADFPRLTEPSWRLTIGPYGYYLFSLAVDVAAEEASRELPRLESPRAFADLLRGRPLKALERRILPRYLAGARWFGGKARVVLDMSLADTLSMDTVNGTVHLTLIQVRYSDGPPERYVLPLAFVRGEAAEKLLSATPHAVLARLTCTGEEGVLADAMHEPAFPRALLDLVNCRRKLCEDGRLVGHPGRGLRRAMAGEQGAELLAEGMLPKITSAEQSNTSAIFGDRIIIKLYRKIEDGLQPEVEISSHLSDTGYAAVPAYCGHVSLKLPGRGTASLAIAHAYVPNHGDAWKNACDGLVRYFERVLAGRGEAELIPPNVPPLLKADLAIPPEAFEQLVGTVAFSLADLLGIRTAELHLAMSGATDQPDFTPEPFSTLYQRSVYQGMQAQAKRVLRQLESLLPTLPEATAALAERLVAARPRLLATLRVMLRSRFEGAKIRIHGDYHLGQVLFTGKDFVIIDFEGEPARSIGERRIKRSPLRDVAGMLRSFQYAPQSVLRKEGAYRPEDVAVLEPWAEMWSKYASGGFLRAYLDTAGDADFLPRERGQIEDLLAAFLLQKAVYEIEYEMNMRPQWLAVPLRGTLDLLDEIG